MLDILISTKFNRTLDIIISLTVMPPIVPSPYITFVST